MSSSCPPLRDAGRMFIQAALNGSRTRAEHMGVPLTPDELAADARSCAEAGASALHVHPRDVRGRETLDGSVVAEVCEAVRSRTRIPMGITTELSIAGDAERRLRLVRTWSTFPDLVTVNVAEDGWLELARWFLDHGVAVEAGVWTPADARRLADAGLDEDLIRVLAEPVGTTAATALDTIDELHRVLDRCGSRAPRLQHTVDASAGS